MGSLTHQTCINPDMYPPKPIVVKQPGSVVCHNIKCLRSKYLYSKFVQVLISPHHAAWETDDHSHLTENQQIELIINITCEEINTSMIDFVIIQ